MSLCDEAAGFCHVIGGGGGIETTVSSASVSYVEEVTDLLTAARCEVYTTDTCRRDSAPGYSDGSGLEVESADVRG